MNLDKLAQLSTILEKESTRKHSVLNIAFAIDQNYLKPCGICINSIVVNNPDLCIDFFIFIDKFNSFGFDEIVEKNSNIRIFVYKINSNYFDLLQTNYHFSTAMYYRLVIAETLKKQVNQIIYLDADIICDNSLLPAIDIELDNNIIGAVVDDNFNLDYCQRLGIDNNRYFNSGVLVINIKEWVNFNVFEKFTKLITSKKYDYPDQDVLNIILNGKTLYLEKIFNDLNQEFDNKSIFIHYVSSPKPWTLAAESNKKYLHYYNISPWKDTPLDLPKNYRDARKLSEKMFKKLKISSAIKWYFIYLIRKFSK